MAQTRRHPATQQFGNETLINSRFSRSAPEWSASVAFISGGIPKRHGFSFPTRFANHLAAASFAPKEPAGSHHPERLPGSGPRRKGSWLSSRLEGREAIYPSARPGSTGPTKPRRAESEPDKNQGQFCGIANPSVSGETAKRGLICEPSFQRLQHASPGRGGLLPDAGWGAIYQCPG